jgi:sulfoxide reductase heme-binding subunit YedZ
LDEALTVIASVPYVRHGALALSILTPLALTSFPKLNARVGLRTWETLHRGVYLAVALVLLHVLAGPSAEPHLAIAIAAIAIVLLLARVVRRTRVRDTSDDEPRDQPPGLDATK